MSDKPDIIPAIDLKLLVSMNYAQAEAIFNQGKEPVVFVLLLLDKWPSIPNRPPPFGHDSGSSQAKRGWTETKS